MTHRHWSGTDRLSSAITFREFEVRVKIHGIVTSQISMSFTEFFAGETTFTFALHERLWRHESLTMAFSKVEWNDLIKIKCYATIVLIVTLHTLIQRLFGISTRLFIGIYAFAKKGQLWHKKGWERISPAWSDSTPRRRFTTLICTSCLCPWALSNFRPGCGARYETSLDNVRRRLCDFWFINHFNWRQQPTNK